MATFDIGLRKNVEFDKVMYWLNIRAKATAEDEELKGLKIKYSAKTCSEVSTSFAESMSWRVFILVTIVINTFITINFYSDEDKDHFLTLVILVHISCFFFWIDFLVMVVRKVLARKSPKIIYTRSILCLVVEAISLMPLSIFYLIAVREPKRSTFWYLRLITLLRFYRLPFFLSKLSRDGKNQELIFLLSIIFYLAVFIDIFANYWMVTSSNTENHPIKNWNATTENKFISSLYFTIVTVLNVGYGDIVPESYIAGTVCAIGMTVGCSITTGVINGALAAKYSNKEKTRELYRHNYKVIIETLKTRKVDKKLLDKISDNLLSLWKFKKGYLETPPYHLLPLSLQKELNFDVNFGFLNRSIIFSKQPRAFLRSVSLMMKNRSYLPGDVIMAPIGITDAMMCVASGVIEILSEENDETPLFSLTTGTIVGEASLFTTVPIRCIIRASTYVELQVLRKTYFVRLALKHPEIYRSMRTEMLSRLNIVVEEDPENDNKIKTLDSDYQELNRRKATKRFIQELKRRRKEGLEELEAIERSTLSLYVISENLPKVKTLPLNLIRAKPWILRPDTNLTELWDLFSVVVITVVVFVYPYLIGFVREINNKANVLLLTTEVVYYVDLYMQCTTAIETKDHFTYVTGIKNIIAIKLKTPGFYLDIIATYPLYIFSHLAISGQPEYAYLLLSQNRVLKFWHIQRYFLKLENSMHSNLLFVRTIKYIYYLSMIVLWSAVMIYIEACPGESCVEDRWYAYLEKKEVDGLQSTPCTEWPAVISLYGACETVSGIGYGDITAKTISDCLVFIFIMILGVCLVTFCLAQASATFRHSARIKTYFQEEMFAISRFMSEHDIPKDLKQRVRNYFQLQWAYDKGFSLKYSTLTEELSLQQKQVEIMELINIFFTIPLFQEATTDFIRFLAESCKIRILPPNEVITDVGDLERDMYILESGYCEITKQEMSKLIGPITPFGHMEMILGVPLDLKVVTVTHVRIVTLGYSLYLRAGTKYPSVKNLLEDLVREDNQNKESLEVTRISEEETEEFKEEQLKMRKRTKLRSRAIINVYSYHKTLSQNYWAPFSSWGKFRFLQFFLVPFVIGPHSLFLKIWMCIRIVSVLVIGLVAPIHFSLFNSASKNTDILILVLQVYAWVDMYLMFHVGYYNEHGILIFHPAKTAVSYLKGNFALDLIGVFPFSLVARAMFPRNANTPSLVIDAPDLIMVLQFYKFFLGCYYLENDILQRTEKIKILKFIPLAIVITNVVAGLLILLQCMEAYPHGIMNQVSNKTSVAYQKSLVYLCIPQANITVNQVHNTAVRLYVMTYYWVTATMTGCGFGDLTAHNKTTMLAVIIIIALGIFLYGYMFAILTSSMISVYNLVTSYRLKIIDMTRLMRKENVRQDVLKRMILHYEYNWKRTEGTIPQQMFTYVHGALREELMASMYESTIRQVPAFLQVDKSITRVIAKYMDEVYFLQGETIVKYNDIQEYIYLIHRGKVDVLSEKGDYITTMGIGGLFGNITKKPFSLSSVNVVAKKNLDMLRLDTKTFFTTLQVTPNTKTLLDFFNTRKTDYIEPLTDTSEQPKADFPSVHAETIPFGMATQRDIRIVGRTEVDFTSTRSWFHFHYSIFKAPKTPVFAFVILPDSPLHNAIEVSVLLASYLSIILSTYIFSFQDFSPTSIIWSYITDIIILAKFCLLFQMSYYDKYSDYVVSKRKIKVRYFTSKSSITVDILSNFPLDFFAFLGKTSHERLLLLSFLRLNRIIRIFYILDFYNAKYKALMINKIYLEMSYLIACTSLMIHLFSCTWFFVACPLDDCQERSWVKELNMEEYKKSSLYFTATYYVISIAATTGYGDIPVVPTSLMVTSVVFMIFSRFGLVLLAGSMVSIINTNSFNLFLYQDGVEQLRASFIRQNVSEYQLSKMWNYLTSLWLCETGRQIPKFISSAPYVLRCEVMYEMFGKHLSQSYLFADTDEAFLRQLSIYLMRYVYFPGNYILQQGDIDHTMYFVHRGQVAVLSIHPDLMETIHFTLIENDNFGMKQGLTIGKAHQFSYRAETRVEILSLTLQNWRHLLKYFPNVGQKINKRVNSLPLEDSQETGQTTEG